MLFKNGRSLAVVTIQWWLLLPHLADILKIFLKLHAHFLYLSLLMDTFHGHHSRVLFPMYTVFPSIKYLTIPNNDATFLYDDVRRKEKGKINNRHTWSINWQLRSKMEIFNFVYACIFHSIIRNYYWNWKPTPPHFGSTLYFKFDHPLSEEGLLKTWGET